LVTALGVVIAGCGAQRQTSATSIRTTRGDVQIGDERG